MKNNLKIFILIASSLAITLFYQNCAKFSAQESDDSSPVLLQAYPNKETLNNDIAAKGVSNTVVLDGQEIHQGPNPNVLFVTHDSGAVIYHSGAPVLNIPIVITLGQLKGEYFSVEALVKKAKAVDYLNCIMLDGIEIYSGDTDQLHSKNCLKLLSSNKQASAANSNNGQAPTYASAPVSGGASAEVISLTVTFPALAGKYNSIAEIQSKAKEIKFKNCLTVNGKNIFFGFGPCVELSSSQAGAPAGTPAVVPPAAAAINSPAAGTSTSAAAGSGGSSSLPSGAFEVASGAFAGSYSSVEVFKSKLKDLNVRSCVTLNGKYVYMGFGPCQAVKSK